MVAVPTVTAVTSPEPSTDATELSLDHSNSTPATAWPLESSASAASRAVSPRARSATESGDTSTPATTCSTVTAAVPETRPAVAVMVAVPTVTAVTSPEASTDAIAWSLDA